MGIPVVQRFTVALAVRNARFTAKTNPFIGDQSHPFQGLDDVFFRARHIPVLVGIFNPKDKSPAVFAGEEIIIQGSANATDMKGAGG